MNIFGKTRIYKKELNGNTLYSTAISSKNNEGKYENLYMSVQLPKGTELQAIVTDIYVVKGFISFYINRDNIKVPKLVITEFNYGDNPFNN